MGQAMEPLKSASSAANKIYDYKNVVLQRPNKRTRMCALYMLTLSHIACGRHDTRISMLTCCWDKTPPPPMMMTLMELIMSAPGSRNRCNKRNCNISLNQSEMRMAYRIHSYSIVAFVYKHECKPFDPCETASVLLCASIRIASTMRLALARYRFHDLHPIGVRSFRCPQSKCCEIVGGWCCPGSEFSSTRFALYSRNLMRSARARVSRKA